MGGGHARPRDVHRPLLGLQPRARGVARPGARRAPIAAVADDWLDGLDHRRIEVEDEGLGTRLRPEFQEIGYSVERLLWMLREDEPPEAVPGVRIEEVDFADTRPLHEAWLVEEGDRARHATSSTPSSSWPPGAACACSR